MDQVVAQAPSGWAEALDTGIAQLQRGEGVPATAMHAVIRKALAQLARDTADIRETPAE